MFSSFMAETLFTLKAHLGVLFHVVFVLLARKLFRNWENTNCGQVFLPLRQVSDKNYGMFLPKAMAALRLSASYQ